MVLAIVDGVSKDDLSLITDNEKSSQDSSNIQDHLSKDASKVEQLNLKKALPRISTLLPNHVEFISPSQYSLSFSDEFFNVPLTVVGKRRLQRGKQQIFFN